MTYRSHKTQIVSFGVEVVGLPYKSAALLLVIFNGVGLPCRIAVPLVAQRIGCINTHIPVLYGTALLTFVMAAVHTQPGLYAFAVLYGIFNASFQCLIPTTVASLTKDLNMVGTRLGMMFSCMGFAALTGPPIGGAIMNAVGSGRHGFIVATMWAGVSALLGATLVVIGRFMSFGSSLKTKC